MSHRGYDVVVDVDEEGDLGHTDLQEDNLQFHSSNFNDPTARSKPPGASNNFSQSSTGPPPASGKSSFSGKRYLWSVSFYSQFFDVDTSEVLRRCQAAVYPRANFLDVLDGNPDLYGPFWIATTVVIILFLAGTISRWLERRGDADYAYDFKLLSGAAGLIYGYTGVIPLALWAALKWSGSEAANVLECWALYGYANVIWIPVAIISWSHIDALNYVFVGTGLAISAIFLTRNLYPIITTTPQQRAKIILAAVLVLHFGLAVAIKILFFSFVAPAFEHLTIILYKSPAASTPNRGGDGDKDKPTDPKDGGDNNNQFLFR